MKRLLTMIGAAAIAAGANADILYVTNAVGNVSVTPASDVKWQFKIDTTANQAYPGYNKDGEPGGSWDKNAALGYDPRKTVTLPRTVAVDGVDYPITQLSSRAFWADHTLANLTVLDNIDTVGWRVFAGCWVGNILFKGPNTQADGTQPLKGLTATTYGDWTTFGNASGLRLVIMGPGVRSDSDPTRMVMSAASNATILVPGDAACKWGALDDSTVGGTNNKVVKYGADHDFAMAMGDTEMTFYPKNETGLAYVLSLAPTIDSAFGMDVRVNVTNVVEIGAGVVTEANAKWLTDRSFCSLVFKVNTQSQLDALLAVVPTSVPFAINPADATETLTVPDGREVYVRLKSGEGRNGKYTPKIYGLTVTVR